MLARVQYLSDVRYKNWSNNKGVVLVLTRGHESANLYVSRLDKKHQKLKHVLSAVSLMKTERNMPIIIKDIMESNYE